jgi:predicted aspartyl protease
VKICGRTSARLFNYAAFWLLLAGLAYAIFDAIVSPKVASALAADGSGEVVIDRSYDQHSYGAGAINGHPVTFMVDTGASVVSVSADLDKVELTQTAERMSLRVRTAN